MKVLWLGQSGLLFVSGKRKVMIDPYLTNSLTMIDYTLDRKMKTNKKIFSVKPDVLILTNCHPDHADIETVSKFARKQKSKLTILSCENVFLDIADHEHCAKANNIMFEEGCEWSIEGFNIRAVKAKTDDKSAFGVIITDTLTNEKYYVAADTLYSKQVLGDLDSDLFAVFVPINGEFGSMNMIDAKRFARDSGARYAVPVHFGMLDKVSPEDFDLKNAIIPSIYRIIDFSSRTSVPKKKQVDRKFNERATVSEQISIVTEFEPSESEPAANDLDEVIEAYEEINEIEEAVEVEETVEVEEAIEVEEAVEVEEIIEVEETAEAEATTEIIETVEEAIKITEAIEADEAVEIEAYEEEIEAAEEIEIVEGAEVAEEIEPEEVLGVEIEIEAEDESEAEIQDEVGLDYENEPDVENDEASYDDDFSFFDSDFEEEAEPYAPFEPFTKEELEGYGIISDDEQDQEEAEIATEPEIEISEDTSEPETEEIMAEEEVTEESYDNDFSFFDEDQSANDAPAQSEEPSEPIAYTPVRPARENDEDDAEKIDAYVKELEKLERGETFDFDIVK